MLVLIIFDLFITILPVRLLYLLFLIIPDIICEIVFISLLAACIKFVRVVKAYPAIWRVVALLPGVIGSMCALLVQEAAPLGSLTLRVSLVLLINHGHLHLNVEVVLIRILERVLHNAFVRGLLLVAIGPLDLLVG